MPVFERATTLRPALLLLALALAPLQAAEEIPSQAHVAKFEAKRLLGSKHDLTSLNHRAGVEAMGGVALTDYGNPCIYCHLPPERSAEAAAEAGSIPGWNRTRPLASQYETYNSSTLQNSTSRPSDISMLCLSCHDGTMAVDRIVFKPLAWNSAKQATLHMQMGADNDINHCGKCHDGNIAHDNTIKTIGTNLRDDHPISIRYAGFTVDAPGFRTADGPWGFDNGVKLYDGKIECASCHDIHKPQAPMLLRVEAGLLCSTCHIK